MNLYMKQEQTYRHRKQTYGYVSGIKGGINQEYGINKYKLVYVKYTRIYCITQETIFSIL